MSGADWPFDPLAVVGGVFVFFLLLFRFVSIPAGDRKAQKWGWSPDLLPDGCRWLFALAGAAVIGGILLAGALGGAQ